MTSEDQDILAKIGQLAGQINRHKNSQSTEPQTLYAPSAMAGRGDYSQASSRWRPSRGAYTSRGYIRGGRPQIHRNRTLVLNGNPPLIPDPASDGPETFAPASGWVSKTDRHMQLINTSVFEKERPTRVKAMEESRKLKLKQRDKHEKSKFSNHLQRINPKPTMSRGTLFSAEASGNYEVFVNDIRFRVAKNGSKLVKVPGENLHGIWSQQVVPDVYTEGLNSRFPGDSNSAKATPKTAIVGGVKFYRSKNGNMFRSGIIKANRRSGVFKKINEPCKLFATMGSCAKGPTCRYTHDPSKVAVCKDFLLKGSCPSGDSCDLSHDLTPQRTPACLHFAKGNCSNPICRFSHVRVSPSAPICRAFGTLGYCERGSNCEERHLHECPDFSNTGKCNTKDCKLPHRHKASVMRTSNPTAAEDGNSDLSSDEDEIDSDDIDSDELDEEFFGDRTTDNAIAMQQDFVHFS